MIDTLQKVFDIFMGLLDHVGPRTNTTKTEIMIFTVGRVRILKTYVRWVERREQRLECPMCTKQWWWGH